jgi:hypothetical protein
MNVENGGPAEGCTALLFRVGVAGRRQARRDLWWKTPAPTAVESREGAPSLKIQRGSVWVLGGIGFKLGDDRFPSSSDQCAKWRTLGSVKSLRGHLD